MTTRRLLVPFAAAASAGLLFAAGPAARAAVAARTAPVPPPITVEAVTTQFHGDVVADLNGMTLYTYDAEADGTVKCTGECLKTWIPLWHQPGTPLYLPQDWKATLGVVVRPEGTEQVTIDGAPVYRFAGDDKPGDTKGDTSDDDPSTQWHMVPAPPTS
jgi:predicted lipoprotein with Yx(FWY)xxD motif